ncbi:MAG: long-chain fatty acid--CoA ligase, partial [Myxococcales bacterium]|nr:long-chain fatty acid--CoA ligase [Myxococcales bacterium]
MAEKFVSLVEMQEKSCARYADNRLFGTKKNGAYEWITYREFAGRVDAFRSALASLGVQRGDKVACIANNSVEWAVGAYATYGLGAHYVPMYEAQLKKEWEFIIKDSGAVVALVATQEIYNQVVDFVGTVGNLKSVVCFYTSPDKEYAYEKLLAEGRKNPVPSVHPPAEEVAGLIYTSGTTGNPKGVILSHGNFCSNINAVQEIFPISDTDTSCSFLPWAHSFGQTVELHVLLAMGSGIGIAESVNTLLDNFGEVRPTILFAVPRIFNRIYDGLQKRMAAESPVKKFMFHKGLAVAKKKRELADKGQQSGFVNWQYNLFDKLVFSKVKARFGGNLRYAFSGGAALSKEVGTFIDDIGILVFEGYGLTETSPIATANTPAGRRLGTIGKPIPQVSIYICDEEQRILPPDTDGEIVVVGPNVMQGYHNNPAATDEVIFTLDGKRAFRTGDMGRVTRDGFIQITGRFKEQYKLENGKYVVPTVLEDDLKLSGYITSAFVHGDNKLYNIALIVPDFESVAAWAKEHGISDTSPAALCKNAQVHAKIG